MTLETMIPGLVILISSLSLPILVMIDAVKEARK